MRKKAFFAAFLAFFVLCGGGRSGDWVIVCRDNGGWTYQVELDSLKITPDGRSICLVRTHKGSHSQQAIWTIDQTRNTIRVGDGPSEKISPGSVAERVRRFLDAQAYLNQQYLGKPG